MRLFLLLFTLPLFAEPLDLEMKGKHVILINAKTNAVLFEKDAYLPCNPASTTKMATALYALQLKGDDLEQKLVVKPEAVRSITPQAKVQSKYRSPPHWLETDGTHIGLRKREEMSLGDLIHAALISSANDACNVIAENLSGSIPSFMEGLNRYLKEIGCHDTYFNNPSGFTHPKHLTTAYDLALMLKVGLEDPIFREIIEKKRHTCPQTNLEYERSLFQTNRLLRKGRYYYPKAIGGKTGTTQAAGLNLVTACTFEGRVLIGALMGYPSRSELYSDAIKLFDAAFFEPKMRRTLLKAKSRQLVKRVEGARTKLRAELKRDLAYEYFPSEDRGYRLFVRWQPPKLPIHQGDRVGSIEVRDESGLLLTREDLLAVSRVKGTLFHLLKRGYLGLLALVLLPLFMLLSKKRRA